MKTVSRARSRFFVDEGAGIEGQSGMLLQGGLELCDGLLDLGVIDITVYDYISGVDEAKGELFLHYEEGIPGLGALGKGVNAVEAGVYLEVEDRGGDHRGADYYDADDWDSG